MIGILVITNEFMVVSSRFYHVRYILQMGWAKFPYLHKPNLVNVLKNHMKPKFTTASTMHEGALTRVFVVIYQITPIYQKPSCTPREQELIPNEYVRNETLPTSVTQTWLMSISLT